MQLAAKTNATIVPFAAIGGDEFFSDPIVDTDALLGLPLIGDWLRDRTEGLPSLVPGDAFIPPIVRPRLEGPRRNYFIFGPPVATQGLDPKDLEACEGTYKEVQNAVYAGIDYLKQARKDDPNEAAIPRIAIERFTGEPSDSFDLGGRWGRVDTPGWPSVTGDDEVCIIVHEDAPPLCVEKPSQEMDAPPVSRSRASSGGGGGGGSTINEKGEVCVIVHEDAPPLCVDPVEAAAAQ